MSHANPLSFKKRHCSAEAVSLCQESELIDLHIDTFIPPRLWGYNPLKRNKNWIFGRHFFGHLDVPRMQEGGVSGAMWSITTNPFRSAKKRWTVFLENLKKGLKLLYLKIINGILKSKI